MKKIVLILSMVLVAVFMQAQTVYVTPSDSNYHKKDCQYLKDSTAKQMTLANAKKAGYTACDVCFSADKGLKIKNAATKIEYDAKVSDVGKVDEKSIKGMTKTEKSNKPGGNKGGDKAAPAEAAPAAKRTKSH